MFSFFASHGGKILSLITAAAALATTQATSLGLSEHITSWLTFTSGVATLAHTLYFPNTSAEKAANT
jgi:hypothetical protein